MPTHLSDDFKLAIVKQVTNGASIYSLSKQFKISPRSIRRWVEKYQQTNSVSREKREVEAYKVYDAHVKYAIAYLRKHPTTTITDLHNHLKQTFPDYDITQQWLGHVLTMNNETRKRTRRYHEPVERFKKPIDMCKVKEEFYNSIRKHNIDDIICLDETAVQLFMYNSYSRCRLGRRCVIKTSKNTTFKSYTLIVAISTQGLIGWRLYTEGGTSTERMTDFLQDYITSKYRNKLIVMDNAPSHRNAEIKKKITSSGNQLLYSVPYYPKSNVVEMLFSQMKHYLRDAKTKNFEELYESIKTVLSTKIAPENYHNYFQYAYSVSQSPMCKRNKSTREKKPGAYKKGNKDKTIL